MHRWGEKFATGIWAIPIPSTLIKVEGVLRAEVSGIVTMRCSTIHSPLRSKGPDTHTNELLYAGICTLAAAQTRGGDDLLEQVSFNGPPPLVLLREATMACSSDHPLPPPQLGCPGGAE